MIFRFLDMADDGEIIDLEMDAAELERLKAASADGLVRMRLGGRSVTLKHLGCPSMAGAFASCTGGRDPWRKPLLSDAMGVNPNQIEEQKAADRRMGAPQTEFTPDGRAIFTSRGHRRRYLKAHCFHDKDGGYGDG